MSEKPLLPTPDALIKAKKQPDLVEVRIPREEAHPFQPKRPTYSNRRGPPIPREEAHPIR